MRTPMFVATGLPWMKKLPEEVLYAQQLFSIVFASLRTIQNNIFLAPDLGHHIFLEAFVLWDSYSSKKGFYKAICSENWKWFHLQEPFHIQNNTGLASRMNAHLAWSTIWSKIRSIYVASLRSSTHSFLWKTIWYLKLSLLRIGRVLLNFIE